jgi:hypothetical protein
MEILPNWLFDLVYQNSLFNLLKAISIIGFEAKIKQDLRNSADFGI